MCELLDWHFVLVLYPASHTYHSREAFKRGGGGGGGGGDDGNGNRMNVGGGNFWWDGNEFFFPSLSLPSTSKFAKKCVGQFGMKKKKRFFGVWGSCFYWQLHRPRSEERGGGPIIAPFGCTQQLFFFPSSSPPLKNFLGKSQVGLGMRESDLSQ